MQIDRPRLSFGLPARDWHFANTIVYLLARIVKLGQIFEAVSPVRTGHIGLTDDHIILQELYCDLLRHLHTVRFFPSLLS